MGIPRALQIMSRLRVIVGDGVSGFQDSRRKRDRNEIQRFEGDRASTAVETRINSSALTVMGHDDYGIISTRCLYREKMRYEIDSGELSISVHVQHGVLYHRSYSVFYNSDSLRYMDTVDSFFLIKIESHLPRVICDSMFIGRIQRNWEYNGEILASCLISSQ